MSVDQLLQNENVSTQHQLDQATLTLASVCRVQGFTGDMLQQSVMWRQAIRDMHDQQVDPELIKAANTAYEPITCKAEGRSAPVSVIRRGLPVQRTLPYLDQPPALTSIGMHVPASLVISTGIRHNPSGPMHRKPDSLPESTAHTVQWASVNCDELSSGVSKVRPWALRDRHPPNSAALDTQDHDGMRTRQFLWGADEEAVLPNTDYTGGAVVALANQTAT